MKKFITSVCMLSVLSIGAIQLTMANSASTNNTCLDEYDWCIEVLQRSPNFCWAKFYVPCIDRW